MIQLGGYIMQMPKNNKKNAVHEIFTEKVKNF